MKNVFFKKNSRSTVPPSVFVDQKKVTANAGETITVQCTATGTPRTQITWYQGQNKMLANRRIAVSSQGHLVINAIELKDAGYYTCLANNSAGQESVTITVNVQSEWEMLCLLVWVCTSAPCTLRAKKFKNGVSSLKKRIKYFFLCTLRRRNFKRQQSPAILDLCSRKTWAGKSRDYRAFEKLRFQNVFRPYWNAKPAFSNSSGLKNVFETKRKRRFHDGLVWWVGLTVEIKMGPHSEVEGVLMSWLQVPLKPLKVPPPLSFSFEAYSKLWQTMETIEARTPTNKRFSEQYNCFARAL